VVIGRKERGGGYTWRHWGEGGPFRRVRVIHSTGRREAFERAGEICREGGGERIRVGR